MSVGAARGNVGGVISNRVFNRAQENVEPFLVVGFGRTLLVKSKRSLPESCAQFAGEASLQKKRGGLQTCQWPHAACW